jgi:Peptidase M50B-like
MGGDNDLQWSCCNDGQSLFILFYIAFSSIAFITLRTLIAKPLRLIAVFIHEMSHASVAWLTGGEVHAIQVYHNEGGVTQYAGGWRYVF